MPDPQRPSGAPLSDSEADRLSERFTASWDDPELAVEPAPPTPPLGSSPAATAPPGPAPSPLSPPGPKPASAAAAPAPLIKPKQTLLGIAPVVVGPAKAPAPAAPPAAAPPAPLPPPAEASIPAPPPSSPDSAVARGLTTPSKPYIPKDDASTPAVVISEAALAPPPAQLDRARIAQTLPAQTRSAPIASPGPLSAPAPSAAPLASAELDDTYPPARRGKSKLPLLFGGLALLGAAAFAAAKLGNAERASPAAAMSAQPVVPPAADPSPTVAAATPAPAATAGSSPATPEPTTAASDDSATPARVKAEPAAKAAPVAKAEPTTARAVTKKTSAAATPRKTTKTDTKPSAAEPAATGKAKGVIVRETPF